MSETIGERIKKLRKRLDLTQSEFAARVGLSGSGLSNYEMGRSTPLNPIIKAICDSYGVRELWLRTGEGEMMADLPKEDVITEFLNSVMKTEGNDIRRRLVSVLARLDDKQWALIAKIADDLVTESAKRQEQAEIDRKVAAYRQELEREKRRESSLSNGTGSSTA